MRWYRMTVYSSSLWCYHDPYYLLQYNRQKLCCARYLHAPVAQPKKMAVSRPRHKPNSANASEEMSWKEPFSSYFSFPLCCTGRLVVVNFDENSLIPKEPNAEKPRVLRRPSGISFVPGTSLHDSKDIITPP